MDTLTDSTLRQPVADGLDIVLPLAMRAVLTPASTDSWARLLADAIVFVAVYDSFDPERLMADVAAAITAAIPEARRRFDREQGQRAELAALVDLLPDMHRLAVKNALGI